MSQSASSLVAIVKMTSSIRLFRFVRKIHQFLGIDQSESKQKRYFIVFKQSLFYIYTTHFSITTARFSMFVANSMFEYGFGFYLFISSVNGTAIYFSLNCQYKNTLKFIENCEKFIEKSEYHIEMNMSKSAESLNYYTITRDEFNGL